METLTLETKDSIALLTLNRPEVLNSINMAFIADMREAVAKLQKIRRRGCCSSPAWGVASVRAPILPPKENVKKGCLSARAWPMA